MKHVYFIGGAMGVGKTATSKLLKELLPKCVFLDGDWCWDMHPFTVNAETREMVVQNIAFLLNNFIACSEYENIIFCWVMDRQEIIDDICRRIDLSGCRLRKISLVCTPEALEKRLSADVALGLRQNDVIERSLQRLPLYGKLDTEMLDVSYISAVEAAEIIAADAEKII